jgi:hypothetical protein
MTTMTLNTAPRTAAITSRLHGFLGALGEAIDAFAAYRMQHAVPESEMRRAEREIARYRHAMHADRAAAAKPARAR